MTLFPAETSPLESSQHDLSIGRSTSDNNNTMILHAHQRASALSLMRWRMALPPVIELHSQARQAPTHPSIHLFSWFDPYSSPFSQLFSPTTISFGFFYFALGIFDILALSTSSSYIFRLSFVLIILSSC